LAYSDTGDVQNAVGGSERLAELTDWDEDEDPDTSVITSIISEADAWIDSFLSKRYSVPIASPVPRLIEAMSANESAFILKRNRSMVTEGDQIHHEERAKMLEDIATGRVTLGVFDQPAKSSLVVDKAFVRPSTLAISREKLKGFA